jgi:hypothetical protein
MRCQLTRLTSVVAAGTVNIDYHIAFDTNYYSVPYNWVHELTPRR